MVKCFSAHQRKKEDAIVKPLEIKLAVIEEPKETREERNIKYYKNVLQHCQNMKLNLRGIPNDAVHFQNQPEVSFDLNQRMTFVRSAMGTGKTKQQMSILQSSSEYKYQLAIAFRRTFSRDSAQKNLLENYEDQKNKSRFNLLQTPKLIIQSDSLCRYEALQDPDILIIDEAQSILTQLISIKRTSTNYALLQFINLLKTAKQILVMDAELEPKTVQILAQLAECDNYKFFINAHKPKTDHQIIVKDFSNLAIEEKSHIVSDVMEMLKRNEKVAVFCTGERFATAIHDMALQTNADLKAKIYTGSDGKKEQGKNMAQQKRDDFKNVAEAWKDLDLLIYTGTLTAGISFELEHFDTLVAIYV